MKPLEGIRVLDLTHLLSGPTCTNMLSLLGAEVIKIEKPGVGDPYRRYAGLPDLNGPFATCNTGKKSVAVNLKHPLMKDPLHKLLAQTDVIVENLRPGATLGLGLDWESVRKIHPRIVYCSISGFGQTGALKERGGLDQIVQAMSGMMWLNGEPHEGPVKVGWPVIDTFTGNMAAMGILAALNKRHMTGEGEYIDVSMLDCALKLSAGTVALFLQTGETPERTGRRGYREVATADIYATSDGYLSLGANQQHQYARFCQVIGRPELAEDPRFASLSERVRNSPALREILGEVLLKDSARRLDEALAVEKVPAAMVRDMHQILNDPHMAERALVADAALPDGKGSIKVVGAGFEYQSQKLDPGPVPALGQQTEEVLRSLGLDDAALATMREASAI